MSLTVTKCACYDIFKNCTFWKSCLTQNVTAFSTYGIKYLVAYVNSEYDLVTEWMIFFGMCSSYTSLSKSKISLSWNLSSFILNLSFIPKCLGILVFHWCNLRLSDPSN
jgi:hypothetical protein